MPANCRHRTPNPSPICSVSVWGVRSCVRQHADSRPAHLSREFAARHTIQSRRFSSRATAALGFPAKFTVCAPHWCLPSFLQDFTCVFPPFCASCFSKLQSSDCFVCRPFLCPSSFIRAGLLPGCDIEDVSSYAYVRTQYLAGPDNPFLTTLNPLHALRSSCLCRRIWRIAHRAAVRLWATCHQENDTAPPLHPSQSQRWMALALNRPLRSVANLG